jgi:hypothetical protein
MVWCALQDIDVLVDVATTEVLVREHDLGTVQLVHEQNNWREMSEKWENEPRASVFLHDIPHRDRSLNNREDGKRLCSARFPEKPKIIGEVEIHDIWSIVTSPSRGWF